MVFGDNAIGFLRYSRLCGPARRTHVTFYHSICATQHISSPGDKYDQDLQHSLSQSLNHPWNQKKNKSIASLGACVSADIGQVNIHMHTAGSLLFRAGDTGAALYRVIAGLSPFHGRFDDMHQHTTSSGRDVRVQPHWQP